MQIVEKREDQADKAELTTTLRDRRTAELVFALVGPVGSGVSTTASILCDELKETYGYECHSYKVSNLIIESAVSQLGVSAADIPAGPGRARKLQELGNQLRSLYSYDYLAKKCIEKILDVRQVDGFDLIEGSKLPQVARPKAKRRVHIIDSIKHEDEVRLLKEVYGDMFWLIGVFAPEGKRRSRLVSGIDLAEHQKIDEVLAHDAHETEGHGQKVRDTFDKADFFIRNDGDNKVNLKKTIDRYLEIVFDQDVYTPFRDEEAMYKAQAAAANSACLSRQVGAAIYSSKGELISVGWNDVPKGTGGLYAAGDGDDDHRCYKWKDKICHNDSHKESLYKRITSLIESRETAARKKLEHEIAHAFVGRNRDSEKGLLEKVLNSVKDALGTPMLSLGELGKLSHLDRLIEFSRAVHAEMEAIISAARDGKSGLTDSTMYVTTFPCHSCARHIVAAGISRVVYIEPYPKSLAKELHADSIFQSDSEHGKEGQVRFEQFQGVAPKNIIRLFKTGKPRKNNGVSTYTGGKKKMALPLLQVAMDGFATNEILIVGALKKEEGR